jgi:chromosome partitioning protein
VRTGRTAVAADLLASWVFAIVATRLTGTHLGDAFYNQLMGPVIAVANQKGGVAKTTTVHTLGAALAERHHRVLLVDLDPQACLTYENGIDPDDLDATIHDVMLGRVTIEDVIVRANDLDLVPSSIDLAGSEIHLLTKTGREFVLRRALRPVADGYDYVFIDCAPSLGILTLNGLTAASHVLIPFQAETLSHRAVGQLLETINDVRAYTNENLEVLGAVATMFDSRTNLGKRILEEISATHELEVLPPPIPRSVKVAEAPGRGRSVLTHAGHSKGADAYRSLAKEIERRT